MAGYSGTPLTKKLGLKENATAYVKNSPIPYDRLLGELPPGVQLKKRLDGPLDFVHLFTKSKQELAEFLPAAKNAIKPTGTIWISWPKKAAKIETDVTENTVREIALPLDLVDIKVCAVDEVWSGLKLVIRKSKR